jgi:hypothetical protein
MTNRMIGHSLACKGRRLHRHLTAAYRNRLFLFNSEDEPGIEMRNTVGSSPLPQYKQLIEKQDKQLIEKWMIHRVTYCKTTI